MSIECECLSWADGGYRETWIDCRKALHKQHCASCFSVPALAPEGSRLASCQIRPEQQGVRSLFFHLSSLSSWPLAPKELFVSGQQRAQYPPGDPDPPSHRGASASHGPRDWKLSVGCWHQVNPGLGSTHRRLSSDHPRKHRSSGTDFNTD